MAKLKKIWQFYNLWGNEQLNLMKCSYRIDIQILVSFNVILKEKIILKNEILLNTKY